MRLSFSTNAFTRHTIFEAVESIAAAGYEGVELLADSPHLFADTVNERELAKLGKILDGTGLMVANVNGNTAAGYYGRTFWEPVFEPSLANPDHESRRWRIDYSRKCIDIARRLGASCVSLTSGRMVPGTSPEKSMDLLRLSLRELLDYAGAKNVRIGIEYEPGLLVECYEELARLIEEMDCPWLGANLDLGHSHVLGEDPTIVIGGLAGRIFNVHLEDIRGRKHYHLIPGMGNIDFRTLFELLDRHAYRGFVTVELYTYPHRPEEAARLSIQHLRGLAPRFHESTGQERP